MLSVVLGFLLTAPFLWWYFIVLRKYKSLESIPGPKPYPIVGNAFDIGATPQALHTNLIKFQKQYGDVFKLFIGPELKVFVANPDYLETIMSSNQQISKSSSYDLLKPWMNLGLLTSTGSKWKLRRKMITPTFHFKILDQFLEAFNSSADILVRNLAKEVGNSETDLEPYIKLHTLEIICETAMGVKLSTQGDKGKKYIKSLRIWLDIFIIRFFSPLKKYDSVFKFFPESSLNAECLETIQNFSSEVIQQRRLEKFRKNSLETRSDDGIKPRVALLEMLLDLENQGLLTNEDIKEEINTFMFEGHDTTTSWISFAFLALAENPEVQEKVYEEIVSVVGNENYVTMQHIQDTKYLDMVVKECLRFYPAVPFVERQLESDFNICGVEFPKDTILNLYLHGTLHNEKYFPNPDVFDPDRFLLTQLAERHNYAFVPFSAGPRNCVGQKFATNETKLTIMKVLREYTIQAIPGFEPELCAAGVLKSHNGIRVRLLRR